MNEQYPSNKHPDKKHGKGAKHGNLTLYGRKPVLEALLEAVQDDAIEVLRVHLSRSNKASETIEQIAERARQAQVPVLYHNKLELSRISRNGRQDQGVAADLHCHKLRNIAALIADDSDRRLIAIDHINNPQNLGMAIRSIAAGYVDGLLLSREAGNARLSPLVIKASAGAFFRTDIYACDALASGLHQLHKVDYSVICLNAGARQSLFELPIPRRCVFVLGNESEGISSSIENMADSCASIPLQSGVESLNVAVTAALISFLAQLRPSATTPDSA